jgi:hypothetical protein
MVFSRNFTRTTYYQYARGKKGLFLDCLPKKLEDLQETKIMILYDITYGDIMNYINNEALALFVC